jgi:hypothetical protein
VSATTAHRSGSSRKKVFQLSKVVGVIFLNYGNRPASTCRVGSADPGIVFDNVGALRKWKMGQRFPGVQRKNGERSVSAT